MFSFLIKKKDRDAMPVEDIIQGPSTDAQNNGGGQDDFIFVENRANGGNPGPGRPQMPMYPPMPAPFGVTPMYPGQGTSRRTPPPIPYVQDVPFVLAPELCTKSIYETTQTEVDGILAILTRQMSMDREEEYTFALERSTIENECY